MILAAADIPIVKILLPVILAFIMFTLGLGLRGADFSRIFKFPKAFGVGLLNQLVVLPLVAFGICKLFKLPPVLALGTMILAFSPGGVTTNVLARIAGGNTALSISMTAVTSLLTIFTVPLLVTLSATHFLGNAAPDFQIGKLGVTMFLLTALPVSIGMLLTKLAPRAVEKSAPVLSKIGIGLFVFIIVAALAKNWQVVWDNLPTLGPALILLNIVLLAVGLLSARVLSLEHRDATTIAIESGVQNGTLGIAVGVILAGSSTTGVTLPLETVPCAVYGITMYLITVPFVIWRKKRAA